MTLTRKATFLVQRSWERFAQRTHLRRLPPLPTVVIVLALGVLVPLAAQVEQRPTQLSTQLAADRLARFARKHPGATPTSGPAGEIYTARPAFFWPAQPGAQQYAFKLWQGDTVVIADETLKRPWLVLRPPGSLQPLRPYRFEAVALDGRGNRLPGAPAIRHNFSVRPAPEDLKSLHELIQMELDPAAGALVLLGYFADKDSPHDVVSGLVSWNVEQHAEPQPGGPAEWLAAAVREARRLD